MFDILVLTLAVGASRWAPACFVLGGFVYLYNGLQRLPGEEPFYPTTAYRFQLPL